MIPIGALIAQFYPDFSTSDQQTLAERCVGLDSYNEFSWPVVGKEEMADETVQLQLIKTLWGTQTSGERGVVLQIMQSLEDWSDNQSIEFSHLSSAVASLYRRLYTFFGFTHFDFLDLNRQMFLLSSDLLPLACIWGIPVYVNVQEYFIQYTTRELLRQDALIFSKSIAANPTPLGQAGRQERTIGEWVKLFDQFVGATVSTRVDEFIENSMEVRRLDPAGQDLLGKILTLYYGLRGGFIWREITADNTILSLPRKKPEQKTFDDHYFDLLQEADTSQYTSWLADWKNIIQWIVDSGRDETFVNGLFYIITKKVNLEDEAQLQKLLAFIDGMKDAGWSLGADLLYFDETDGKFHWNQQIVDLLKEEVEYLDSQKRAGQAPEVGSAAGPPAKIARGIKELTK